MYISEVIKPGEMFKWKGTVRKLRKEQEMIDEAEERKGLREELPAFLFAGLMFLGLYGVRLIQNII